MAKVLHAALLVIEVGASILAYLIVMVVMAFAWAGVDRLWSRLRGRPVNRRSTGAVNATAPRLRARMSRMARPTLLLVPAKAPGFSKVGGDPELSADLTWPAGERGLRTFLAQIDLGAFRPHVAMDWLPGEGRVYAFYDPDREGFADVVRILYSTEPAGPAVTVADPRRRFVERRVAFMAFDSIPSLDWLNVDIRDLDLDIQAFEESLATIADAPPADELQHRIGGYPNEIQEDCMRLSCEHLARGLPPPVYGDEAPPAIERASREWRLLIQIDSDEALGMNFGDGGRFYVFVRERHARAGDFSKTVAISQTS